MKDNDTSSLITQLSDDSPSLSVNSVIAGKISYIFNVGTSNIEAPNCFSAYPPLLEREL